MKIAHLKEGWRIYKRRQRVNKEGLHKYQGSAKEICQQIIEDCWNGSYFQTSTDHGHYNGFFMRDFGWAIDSLLELGHEERILKTLEHIMTTFSKHGLTTTITPEGKCIDIFRYSPDSVSYLIKCLKVAKATDLINQYRDFLASEVEKCFKLVLNPSTAMVKPNVHFGSMKDSTNRSCSTYDNVMLAMLSRDLDELGMKNPFKEHDVKNAIKEELWNGHYFYDDISKTPAVTGDSNLFPFWTDVFEDEEMLKASMQSIQDAGLDDPFPLKYSNEKISKEIFWRKWLVSDYQTHSIKTHMGALYIHVLKRVFPKTAKQHVKTYTNLIETHGTYLENFTAKGEPLNSRFYFSDEGDIWCANYLTLLNE